MRALLARVRALWVRLRAQWRSWRGEAAWPCEPVDATHADYRKKYEETLPLLKHLPRGYHHERAFERRNTILYLAELLDGLHNFGDDPIMPPYARRAMREEAGKSLWQPAARPRGLLGALAGGGVMQWVAAGGAAFGLLGFATAAVQGIRVDRVKAQNERLEAALASSERVLADRTAERDILAANIEEAAKGAQQAAETIEAERARANAARRRERELLNEIRSRTADVGEPPAWGLRNGEGGDPAGPGDRASGDPG